MTIINHQTILEAGRYRELSLNGADPVVVARLHRFMLRLRRCEEALAREYHPADEMRCPVHFCIGQEAVPAALSESLTQDDYLFSHHRSHGYFLAKGAPMRAMFAEIYGKETGANGGKAGSQDISYAALNFFSGAILAGATAIAAGAALGFQLRNERRAVVAGFGESATDEGIFWETVNYAALRRLPLVLVCENNNYSVFSPMSKRQAVETVSDKVAAFGMKSVTLFGNDVIKVHAAIADAVEAARSGKGPTFIEAYTYRWSGHYGPESDDLVGYRSQAELDAWKANCPIALLEEALTAQDWLSTAQKTEMLHAIDSEIEESFSFAKTSPFPRDVDWAQMNLSNRSPLADKLLMDIDLDVFDENQTFVQAKGY
ncbi:thiamine pyrophosphate-dependent dehydrogenase E1 component subunit alpha [Sulfuricaulis sp.]|jgi:TPP-dependent pyruvate/acetoin dehydrogenase alpha subunit|uniref:thiamine pyrophosphate-dependent dehydrogenase E1 component subunit alpha n=1 Tax=Sulfuricaulis sp. TaxID=2003553 RepID=UPI00355A1EE8